jgi:hypothetical protein
MLAPLQLLSVSVSPVLKNDAPDALLLSESEVLLVSNACATSSTP